MVPQYNFERILQTLVEYQVDFIVIGGVCAVLQGAPVSTFDVDIVHSRAADNLPRLLAALQQLQAHYRHQGDRRLVPNLSLLASPGHHLLTTVDGPLDVLGTVTEERGYDELLPHTEDKLIALDVQVRILDLPTLIQLKEAAGRDKDKMVLPTLRHTLAEKNKH